MRLVDDNWEYVARGVRNTVGFDWHPETKNFILEIMEGIGWEMIPIM